MDLDLLIFTWFGIAFPGACMLCAAVFIAARKKPLVLRSALIMLCVFTPVFASIFAGMHDIVMFAGRSGYIGWIAAALFAGAYAGLWIQLRGYIILGAPKESMTDAVRFALNKNNILFEQEMLKIKLVSVGGFLRIIPTGLYFRLVLEKSKERESLGKIAAGIREYYIANSQGVSKLALLHLSTAGIAALAMSALASAELLEIIALTNAQK